MVYLGRPSRGCLTCRTRRIKCDEGKPTCNRCAKSKRECGGYRPEFEVMHRDQTTPTMMRRMKKTTIDQESSAALTLTFVYEQPQQSQSPSPGPSLSQDDTPSPQPMLSLPLAQRAACHFASNFILLPQNGDNTRQGFLSYIIPLIKTEPSDSPLLSAFNACALALLSNLEKADSVNLSNMTLKEHTLALARTHAALGKPATANLDSTLATVLLLSLFESITAVKETQMLTWRTHLQGAINIVKARGHEQLRSTKMGTILLNAVRQQLIARTLSEGTAPPMGVDWWMGGSDIDLTPIAAASQRLALRTAALRAEVTREMDRIQRTDESRDVMIQLILAVQSLDRDVATFLHTVPPESGFKTLCWISDTDPEFQEFGDDYSKADFYPGRIDVYPDIVTASVWNTARVTRLILASLNIRLTAWLSSPTDYRETPEYGISRQICEGLITDIISSVPYHLGWRDTNKTCLFETSTELSSGFACGLEGPAKALPALFLSWPLVSIKNHDFCQPNQREWASGRLKYIEANAGLKYAGVVNEVGWIFSSDFT